LDSSPSNVEPTHAGHVSLTKLTQRRDIALLQDLLFISDDTDGMKTYCCEIVTHNSTVDVIYIYTLVEKSNSAESHPNVPGWRVEYIPEI